MGDVLFLAVCLGLVVGLGLGFVWLVVSYVRDL